MPRQDRTIPPITTLPKDVTPETLLYYFNSLIDQINLSLSSLDQFESEARGEDGFTSTVNSNIQLNGHRVKNALPSESDTDYVTRGEMRSNGLYVDHTGALRTNKQIIAPGFNAPPGTPPSSAPIGAEYVVASADPFLSAERVATSTATIVVDLVTAGQIKFDIAELDNGWSVTNVTPDKTYDASATTLNELSNVVGTLISLLLSKGILGA